MFGELNYNQEGRDKTLCRSYFRNSRGRHVGAIDATKLRSTRVRRCTMASHSSEG